MCRLSLLFNLKLLYLYAQTIIPKVIQYYSEVQASLSLCFIISDVFKAIL